MAVDTRSKRASALQLLSWPVLAEVAPDGTLSQGDRQHAAHSYSGILAGVSTLTVLHYDLEARLGGSRQSAAAVGEYTALPAGSRQTGEIP